MRGLEDTMLNVQINGAPPQVADLAPVAAHDGESRQQRFQHDPRLALVVSDEQENVAQAVVYMASLPLNANVQTITVMATKMPFIGRG